jgi:hypothetical protein
MFREPQIKKQSWMKSVALVAGLLLILGVILPGLLAQTKPAVTPHENPGPLHH